MRKWKMHFKTFVTSFAGPPRLDFVYWGHVVFDFNLLLFHFSFRCHRFSGGLFLFVEKLNGFPWVRYQRLFTYWRYYCWFRNCLLLWKWCQIPATSKLRNRNSWLRRDVNSSKNLQCLNIFLIWRLFAVHLVNCGNLERLHFWRIKATFMKYL